MTTKLNDSESVLPVSVVFTAEGIAYEFIRDLGKGILGERILLARPRRQDGPGEPVVIKSLSATDNAQARKRLANEVRIASLLQHPGITRVYGLHEVEDTLYVVTEYVESRSMDELYTDALLCGTYLSERFVLYVAAELASALHAAHTLTDAKGKPLGVVHRDLHPERIRMDSQGQVQLGGFSLATSRRQGRRASPLSRALGPVVYASPEQLLRRPVDARSDLFSLGLVMLELLTGQHLYRLLEDVDLRLMGLNMTELPSDKLRLIEATIEELSRLYEAGLQREGLAQLAKRASSFGAEDVERLAQDLSEPTRLILHKLLRQDPEERYRSAAELEQALRECLQAMGPFGASEAAEEAFMLQAAALGLTSMEPGEEAGELLLSEEEDITTEPC